MTRSAPTWTDLANGLSAPLRFAHLPTPLEPMDRLSERLGGPRIWVKRDDCTGLFGGGNKTRKLEWVLADAVAAGATTLLTTGALQSNHARQTAAAAARTGLSCELHLVHGVPGRSPSYQESGNLLLERLTGATVVVHDAGSDADAILRERALALEEDGERPYVIPTGASNLVGSLGYAECARELLQQTRSLAIDPRVVVTATGSGGTQAGLMAGFALAGSDIRVLGVSVGATRSEMAAKLRPLSSDLAQHLGLTAPAEPWVTDSHVGPDYGIPTQKGIAAIRLVAETEGIALDPVYTGKAMACLLHEIREKRLPAGDVVFLHTGGWPALFAYPEAFAA